MPHVQTPRVLATILVAASCAGVSATAVVPGKDRPGVERNKAACQTVLNRIELEKLPTATGFDELAKIVPGPIVKVTADFTFDNRGRANRFIVDGIDLSAEAGVQRVDPDTCDVLTKWTKAEFGDSGVSGSVQFLYRPEAAWLQGTFKNLSRGRERFSPTFKLEWRGVRNLEPRIPSDPGTPGVPVPGVPAPSTGFPIYLGGPLLLNGARANGKVWAIPHTNCDSHTVIQGGVSYRMCLAGEGDTSLTAFNVTPKNFDFRKDPIPQGWEWNPFACEPGADGTVGCTAKGKYRGYDILSTITNLQVTPGTLNFGANINVRLLSTGGDVGFRAAGQVESLGN